MSDRVEVVRAVFSAWNERDVEAMLEHAHAEMDFVPVVAAMVEGGGAIRGHEDFRRFFAALPDAWEEISLDMREFEASGDAVVASGRMRGIGRGSGVEVDEPLWTVAWFSDGKVRRLRSFFDAEEARAAARQEVPA